MTGEELEGRLLNSQSVAGVVAARRIGLEGKDRIAAVEPVETVVAAPGDGREFPPRRPRQRFGAPEQGCVNRLGHRQGRTHG